LEVERADARLVVGVLARTAVPWARSALAAALDAMEAGRPVRAGLRELCRDLARFTVKLNKAARRRGGDTIRPARILKVEGRRAFEWLILYFYPDVPDDLLRADELEAVRRLVGALARALTAKPHRPRQARTAAERYIEAARQFGERDERRARRLEKRLRQEDEVLGRPATRITPAVVSLLAGKVSSFVPPA
jgi:hypothetical protein